MATEKTKKREKADDGIDVCSGGTISTGALSITFTNGGSAPVTIPDLALPGFVNPATIPASSNGNKGSQLFVIQPASGGPYIYHPAPCQQGAAPEIKVQ
jgi:hypothetical protein